MNRLLGGGLCMALVGIAIPFFVGATGFDHPATPASTSPAVSRAPEPSAIPSWRSADHDAVNCLYLQCRYLGYRGDYTAFRAIADSHGDIRDLKSLTTCGGQVGIPLTPVRLTTSELLHLGEPTVVFIEEEGVGSGTFWLFLGASEQGFEAIDGTTMNWVQVPREAFLRDWTGYALIRTPTRPWTSIRRTGTFAIAMAAIIVLARRRSRVALTSDADLTQ